MRRPFNRNRFHLKGGSKTVHGNALGIAIQDFTFALKGPGK